ncbi:MAG: hypothetical protein COU08_03510 [Candidatus Harrisonbacteria bacterium CG10_big_fil_rev_8_21_14_0_10_42_17]|uniref:Uncharacterized protein n=1 Tax=Candidatus Harrisonbacteria bacterium CG10_big_fil_rev_8_21_14_0_10_42_17 TaxID=1974584 RepID=A0A2M6WHF3_9BACT|nr:MAG: hypothetical protein COU08_03510 [Candidatus Harrisonbacteria bacterium CG10_big_fil_rev_8_21_14_0_10_42_17]
MQQNTAKNIPLMIGIAIPLLMVVFVALAIYLPGATLEPQFDFLYYTGGNFGFDGFRLEQGHVAFFEAEVSEDQKPFLPRYPEQELKLYRHNVLTDTSVVLTLEEAQLLTLDSNPISPDGFRLTQGRGGDGFSFFPFFYNGGDYRTWYLTTKRASKPLTLQVGENSYYDVTFLGWVNEQ